MYFERGKWVYRIPSRDCSVRRCVYIYIYIYIPYIWNLLFLLSKCRRGFNEFLNLKVQKGFREYLVVKKDSFFKRRLLDPLFYVPQHYFVKQDQLWSKLVAQGVNIYDLRKSNFNYFLPVTTCQVYKHMIYRLHSTTYWY